MNTIEDYTVVDARLSYKREGMTFSLYVFNLINNAYSPTAYQDPAGSDVIFLVPAALRTAMLGFQLDW